MTCSLASAANCVSIVRGLALETAARHDHYPHQQLTAFFLRVLCVSVQYSIACWWLFLTIEEVNYYDNRYLPHINFLTGLSYLF